MLLSQINYNKILLLTVGGVFMSVWVAMVLGLIQGLTEFLPVSSSGHLTFFELIFGFSEGNVLYNIILHIATLLALVIVMWRDIVEIIKNPLSKYVRLLLISTIITGIVGLALDIIVGAEGSLLIIAIGFIITAGLLCWLTIYQKSKKYNALGQINYKQSAIVGFVQGIAVLPGLSRSGSTLVAGVVSGAGQVESAKFSFLLSIPIILLGTVYEIIKGFKVGFGFTSADFLPMAIGFVVAFVSAALTLKLMFKLVRKNKWLWFSLYLLIFGISIIVVGAVKGVLL